MSHAANFIFFSKFSVNCLLFPENSLVKYMYEVYVVFKNSEINLPQMSILNRIKPNYVLETRSNREWVISSIAPLG